MKYWRELGAIGRARYTSVFALVVVVFGAERTQFSGALLTTQDYSASSTYPIVLPIASVRRYPARLIRVYARTAPAGRRETALRREPGQSRHWRPDRSFDG